MDRFSYWTLISTFWVIKFIIWLAATLACDYPGYPTEGGGGGSIFNFSWEQRSIAVGHLSLVTDCRKKGSVWRGCVGLGLCVCVCVSVCVCLLLPFPFSVFSPLFSLHPLANIFSPTLLFAKIRVTMATNWRFYEHLIPHLNIPSYLW